MSHRLDGDGAAIDFIQFLMDVNFRFHERTIVDICSIQAIWAGLNI